MASISTKRLTYATLHKALHRNVYLLSLQFPMSKDLLSNFKEGMFEKPNRVAFHQLSYYLMSIIDNKYLSSTTSWAVFEIKMEAEHRVEFLKFVNHTSVLHEDCISHITPSWLVNAGGIKVTKLMFELSQVALKVHITSKDSKFASLNPSEFEALEEQCQTLTEKVGNKIKWWHTYSRNMQKIADIYKQHTPILITMKESKTKLLNDVVHKIVQRLPVNSMMSVKELNNIFISPAILKNWCLSIDEQTSFLEKSWGKHSNFLTNSKKCKSRNEQVVQRHTKKCSKDTLLEYNPSKDKFKLCSVYENDLSPAQYSILRSNVKNGVLDFPNLLKSYAVVISHGFRSFSPPNSDEEFLNIIEEKKKLVFFIQQQSKDLVTEVFRFYNQLKDEANLEILPNSSFLVLPWIEEAFRIPTIPKMVAPFDTNNVEYWSKLFANYKFSQFSCPLQNKQNKRQATVYKMPVTITHKKQNKSDLCKQLLITSCKKQNIEMPNDQPEYMKNIEEIQKNMNKISVDVSNKSNYMHSNISRMSFMNATDVKHPKFSSHHIHKLLTSAKKLPVTSVKKSMHRIHDRSFQKKWGNLFNESSEEISVLHKTQSSPDLLTDKKTSSMSFLRTSIKSNERISGIKEIDYSSFLSGLGSTPNLTNSSNNKSKDVQENCDEKIFITPEMRSKIISLKESTKIENNKSIFETPENCKKTSICNKNSVERIIATYKKVKESMRANELLAKKRYEENIGTSDSLIRNLDGCDKAENRQKATDKMCLSNVPDLLSPNFDFRSRNRDGSIN